MAESFPELRAAAIDGRAHNVSYRQHQLEALHQALLDHASEIRQAMTADYDYSSSESAVEFHLAMNILKRNYETIQPTKALADEYALANGNDAPANRVPAGIVYIQPCSHALLFSVIAPLSAAMAAGSCVIVLLENNLRSLSGVLRRTLQGALHPDTFAAASSPVRDPAILNEAIVLDQNSDERWPRANQLASPSSSCTFAVVDRTADVKIAARELTAARFGFGGSSPYAPDLVLVNEFVKSDLLQALTEETRKIASSGEKSELSAPSRVSSKIEALKKVDPDMQIVVQKSKTNVVDLTARNPEMLQVKTSTPVLTIHAVKSLDDAIDFIGSANTGPALAAYHFGNAQVGKYLAQFIDARVSFVNHVPRELLVGPAHPAGYDVDPASRYSVEMFTLARPGFIQPSNADSQIAAALASADSGAAQKLLEQALAPLKAMKRKPGGGVGFFEQGFLLNAGMLLTITLSATIAGSVWLVRNGRLPTWSLRV